MLSDLLILISHSLSASTCRFSGSWDCPPAKYSPFTPGRDNCSRREDHYGDNPFFTCFYLLQKKTRAGN